MNDLHTYYYIGGYVMDTKTLLQKDLENLAKEHEEIAREHLLLARMYRRMQGDASAFVDTYEDYE